MKKLMTLMLGLALTFGTVAAFSQGKDDSSTTGKKKSGKKGKSKKTDDTTKK